MFKAKKKKKHVQGTAWKQELVTAIAMDMQISK